MRFEVALTVFADDVLTALDGEITWIKGDGRLFPLFAGDVRDLGRRVVAFSSNN
jgi:hypothetical protein